MNELLTCLVKLAFGNYIRFLAYRNVSDFSNFVAPSDLYSYVDQKNKVRK